MAELYKNCAVVTRQLHGHAPVVSQVVVMTKETASTMDSPDSYLESRAKDYINDFKEQFAEFREGADWSIEIRDNILKEVEAY